jgi:two-component system KDP operon response regulator KdpE
VSVTDHGPGINRAQRDEMFGLPARRDRDAGAGLGLTIAQTFVEAHGQRSGWRTRPGAGQEFCFTLPIAPIPEEPTVAAILIVDDDPDLLNVCTRWPRSTRPRSANRWNRERGSREAATRAPDIIVLDLGLPDLDGLEVCKRIRSWSDVPIIVLSADGSEDRKVEALDDGADDYMTKPFAMRELDARLRVRSAIVPQNEHQPNSMLDLFTSTWSITKPRSDTKRSISPQRVRLSRLPCSYVGKVCTRRMILENVWGPGYVKEQHYLKVYAYRIRRKLGDERGQFLQSDPSVGYRLAQPQ